MSASAGIEELVTHAGWLRRVAVALVRDDDAADDLVQGTLIAAWQNPPASDRDVKPWLAEVARNQAHNQRRSERRRQARQEAAADLAAATSPTPEQLVGDLQLHRAVAEAVTALAEPFRQTMILRYYEGLPAVDIGRRLGVPAGTVRWRLKEGLERVRVELDRRHDGDRKRWLALLGPLLPERPGAPPPPRSGLGWNAGAAVSAAVLLAAGAGLLIAGALNGQRPETTAPTSPATAIAVDPSSSAGAPPRFAGGRVPPAPAIAPSTVDPDSRLRRMIAAVIANAYDDFLADVDDRFKASMSKQHLEDAVNELGPRLAQGYQLHALGTLRKPEGLVHLWKLELADGGDDLLAKMTLSEGRIIAFEIH